MKSMGRVMVAISLLFYLSAALAQKWPEKPIRLIVPYAAGGSLDAVARTIGPRLSAQLGQQILVDNRVGADSLIGTQSVIHAAPDGYTLLLQSPTLLINHLLEPEHWVDPRSSLTFISPIASTPYFLFVNPKLGVNTFQDLAALGKKTERKLDYASASAVTLFAERMISKAAGYETVAVPFKGGAGALTAVMAGDATYSIDSLMAIRPFVSAEKIRVLAVTSATRSKALPGVPTLAESGISKFSFVSWWGVMGPRGMDPNLVKKINEAVAMAVADPNITRRLESLAATTMQMSPDQFTTFVAEELARLSRR